MEVIIRGLSGLLIPFFTTSRIYGRGVGRSDGLGRGRGVG